MIDISGRLYEGNITHVWKKKMHFIEHLKKTKKQIVHIKKINKNVTLRAWLRTPEAWRG